MAEEKRDRFGRVWRLKGPLTQGDVEAWNRSFVEMRPVGTAGQRGAQLRAAIVAGWIVSPASAVEQVTDLATGRVSIRYLFDGVEVSEMRPGEVHHYGRLCEAAFQDAMRIPEDEEKN